MDKKLNSFLTWIIVNAPDATAIRSRALDLMREPEAVNDWNFNHVVVPIYNSDNVIGSVPLTRKDYTYISTLMRENTANNNNKIVAIKHLRTVSNGDLGLKEAKDTVEHWNFLL